MHLPLAAACLALVRVDFARVERRLSRTGHHKTGEPVRMPNAQDIFVWTEAQMQRRCLGEVVGEIGARRRITKRCLCVIQRDVGAPANTEEPTLRVLHVRCGAAADPLAPRAFPKHAHVPDADRPVKATCCHFTAAIAGVD